MGAVRLTPMRPQGVALADRLNWGEVSAPRSLPGASGGLRRILL
jgi:hypothetical protein